MFVGFTDNTHASVKNNKIAAGISNAMCVCVYVCVWKSGEIQLEAELQANIKKNGCSHNQTIKALGNLPQPAHNNHHCIAFYLCKYVVFIFVIKIVHSRTKIERNNGKNQTTTLELRRHSVQWYNRGREKGEEERKKLIWKARMCVANNQIWYALV